MKRTNVEFLIVGLGNPGKEYVYTRHNIGFIVIDRLFEKIGILKWGKKYKGFFCSGNIGGSSFALLKPLTYVNLSGESVISAFNSLSLTSSQLLVIYDDVDLPIGEIKFRRGGSAGGHNGIENIIYHFNSNDFFRLRIGIGPRIKNVDLKDYVLSNFTETEINELEKILDNIVEILIQCIKFGPIKTQNIYKKLL
ncbi:MAG: aminoacyl-tRNA hydrolase [Candidatus Hydrogenedentota bacterium]